MNGSDTSAIARSQGAAVRFAQRGNRLEMSGDLHIQAVEDLDQAELQKMAQEATVIDITQLSRMDTAGAWVLLDLQQRATTQGRHLALEGATDAQAQLIDVVRRSMPPQDIGAAPHKTLTDRVEGFGKGVVSAGRKTVELTSFLGQVVATLAGILIHPRRLRLTSLVHHCQEVGLNAVPIVALMAFLIGVVLAFQGVGATAPVRGRSLRRRPDRHLGAARTGHPVDRDHRGGPVRVRLHRCHRLHEDARGDRRHAHPRPRSGNDPGGAARAGADADAARAGVHRRPVGPGRRGGDVLDRTGRVAGRVPIAAGVEHRRLAFRRRA